MRILAKLFGGLVVSAFALMLALTLPGTGSAEAYTSYNYTSYRNYTSYQPSTTYNYYRYNYNPTSYSNYTNYTKYNNYSNYTNYQKPNYSTPSQPNSTPSQPSTQTTGNVNTADEQAMLNLINKERVANGLQPLTADAKLTEVARLKAKDMIANNYFGHTSPTYGSPFDMMKANGITYTYAGENLAGAPDVNTAHTNLMNSPSHKANILKPEYTKVGIGVVEGGPYGKMFVQEFTG